MKPAARPNGQRRSIHNSTQRCSRDSDPDDRLFDFLRKLQAEQYFPVFQREEIRFEDVSLLTRSDLRDMGIPIGPARRIMAAVGDEFAPTDSASPDEAEKFANEPKETSQEILKTGEEVKEDAFSKALLTLSKEQQGLMRMMQDLQTAISELQTPVVSEPDLSPSHLHMESGSNVSFERMSPASVRRETVPDISLRLRSHTLSSLAKQRRLPNKYMRVSNLRMSYLLRSQLSARTEE